MNNIVFYCLVNFNFLTESFIKSALDGIFREATKKVWSDKAKIYVIWSKQEALQTGHHRGQICESLCIYNHKNNIDDTALAGFLLW